MDRIIHLILLLSGLCSLSSCVPRHQYSFVQTPKTWYEAQSYCREHCLDLATIDDMSEMETGLKLVQDKFDGLVWIGLRKGSTKAWHWSLADKDFYNEGERNYVQLSLSDDPNCGVYQAGKLSTHPCTYNRYSMCFDGRKQGRDQYVLIRGNMIWTAARDYCRTHHTDLASVRNDTEFQIIQEVAGDLMVWIGLFRDVWEWSDQTYSSFRYWKPGQHVYTSSQKACGVLLKSASGRWGERPCGESHKFLCNCVPKLRIKVRISSRDSVLEQNEPAVQDDILKQIEEELRKKTGTVGIKLQWKKHPDGRVFIKEPHRSG